MRHLKALISLRRERSVPCAAFCDPLIVKSQKSVNGPLLSCFVGVIYLMGFWVGFWVGFWMRFWVGFWVGFWMGFLIHSH